MFPGIYGKELQIGLAVSCCEQYPATRTKCQPFLGSGSGLVFGVSSFLPEAVLLGLLRRLMATAPGPLALLPGGGFGGTWGSTSWALPIHYMAFLRAGRGWRWGWGPGIKLAEGPMSSFCHQEVERVTEVSGIDCLLPHLLTSPPILFTEPESLALGL